ncbi:MAG: amidohydrolase family protein [Kineosporiaceae bacterium]
MSTERPTVAAVDVHAHAMPLPVLEWLAGRGLADLSGVEHGIVVLDPMISGVGSGAPLPLPRSMVDASVRLAEMDATGVSHEALSLPPFLLATMSRDGALVAELLDRGTQALIEYCSADPERLRPLGAVPVGFTAAADTARTMLDSGVVSGIAVGSRGAGAELDDAVNADLWALLSEREAFVLLHPSGVPDPNRLADFWFPQLVGYPMETAVAASRLVFSGVLEAHPLRLCLAHGGGCLPSLRGRLDLGWHRKPVAHTTSVPPRELFDRLYYDTAVFDPAILRRLVEDVGADHVLLGTDHPFDLAERDPIGFVDSAGLDDAARRLILHRTAARLLGLDDE